MMRYRSTPLLAAALLAGACAVQHHSNAPSLRTTTSLHSTTFATPEEAMHALVASADDPGRSDSLLGPGGADLLCGCEAEDGEDLAAVRAMMRDHVAFVDAGSDRKLVLVGKDQWELPVSLVNVGGAWRFDVDAAKDEILCRSVGGNELRAIATLRELVDAQQEYFETEHDGRRSAYAPIWRSTPGKHDGLYWETAAGEPASPLGPLFCRSALETPERSENTERSEPTDRLDPTRSAPCHGYCYRILPAQGPHAWGGARSYRDQEGHLTSGFAFLAWPEDYCGTGVMTFQVNQVGIVLERDLGPKTAQEVEKITAFDPDNTWEPVTD